MIERHRIFRKLLKQQQARKKAEAEAARLEKSLACASKYRHITRYKGRWLVTDPRNGTHLGCFPTEEAAASALSEALGIHPEDLLRARSGVVPRALFRDWLYGR